MNTCSIVAVIGWISVAGTFVAGWVGVANTRRGIAKENANRRIMLERYADDVGRYHRDLRRYLLELEQQGVVDMTRVDLSKFPPPPAPTYDGK